MYKQLSYLFSFVLVLGVTAGAANGGSLWGYYPINENDLKDYSGNDHHGTAVDGAVTVLDSERGWVVSFKDQPNQPSRINCGTDDPSTGGELSVSIWIKWDGLNGNWQGMAGKSFQYGQRRWIFQLRDSDGLIQWGGTDSEGLDIWSDVAPEIGEWQHVAGTHDGSYAKVFINGEIVGEGPSGFSADSAVEANVTLGFGEDRDDYDESFNGLMDEIYIYSRTLSDNQILDLYHGIPPSFTRAENPNPANGALHFDTWANLSWSPGDTAVTHDIYFGDNFNDVNDGAPDTFQGNQNATFIIVGFPGFAFPDGLVPGMTYYWRIDEVEADGTTKHKGIVWSFMVPPKTAYDPVPADGAKFLEPDVELSWTAGYGAKLHTVYFGENFDDVNEGTGETAKGSIGITSYTPGALEPDKVYYWRVDEFDAVDTFKGEVWSFTTAGAGGGVRADYYNGMNFETHVLTRVDPQISFNWGDPGSPDAAVGNDYFSVRWSGEVEAAFTETYSFYTNTDDGVRLWVDGRLLIDRWVDQSATEYKGKIDLVAGQTYSIVMEYYENGGGAVAELRWESPRTPKQLIPQAALSLPVKASSPKPSNGSVDTKQIQILSWSAGEGASSHQVYLGTDEEAVGNADTGSPEYKGTRTLGSESYDAGKLDWDVTYYWRVDEVEADGTIQKGNVWSFTTANFLIVDDFEGYDADENQIWYAWKDGLGYGTAGTDPYYAGNGTGSAVGDENSPSYTEETMVHGGRQAMPLAYDNNKQGFFKYSEAEMTLTYPRDWTENGVSTLTIWFRGDLTNAAEPLYVTLNGSAVVRHDNPEAAQASTWTEWNIDLQLFADQGVNLVNVNTIALGLGNRDNPVAGGSGTVYFDDIRLYRPATEP
jgi:hypothetical protein